MYKILKNRINLFSLNILLMYTFNFLTLPKIKFWQTSSLSGHPSKDMYNNHLNLHSKHVQRSTEPAIQPPERRQQGNACVLRVKSKEQGPAAPRPISDLYSWTMSLQGIREVALDLERKNNSTEAHLRSCSYETLTDVENIRKKKLSMQQSLRQLSTPTSEKHEKVRKSSKMENHLAISISSCIFSSPVLLSSCIVLLESFPCSFFRISDFSSVSCVLPEYTKIDVCQKSQMSSD